MKHQPKKFLKEIVFLDHWHVCAGNNILLYQIPEQERGIRLGGRVHNHPNPRLNGSCITTTPVANVEDNIITTRFGTQYYLNDINPYFREWLYTHKPNWDPENPVTMCSGGVPRMKKYLFINGPEHGKVHFLESSPPEVVLDKFTYYRHTFYVMNTFPEIESGNVLPETKFVVYINGNTFNYRSMLIPQYKSLILDYHGV